MCLHDWYVSPPAVPEEDSQKYYFLPNSKVDYVQVIAPTKAHSVTQPHHLRPLHELIHVAGYYYSVARSEPSLG